MDLARITTDGTISFLYVQTSFKSQNPPRKNDVVIITPKANKTDYNSTKQTLRKWLNNEGNLDEPLTTVLLSPLGQAQYWQLEEGLIPKKVEIGDDHYDRVKNWTTRLLNTEQVPHDTTKIEQTELTWSSREVSFVSAGCCQPGD